MRDNRENPTPHAVSFAAQRPFPATRVADLADGLPRTNAIELPATAVHPEFDLPATQLAMPASGSAVPAKPRRGFGWLLLLLGGAAIGAGMFAFFWTHKPAQPTSEQGKPERVEAAKTHAPPPVTVITTVAPARTQPLSAPAIQVVRPPSPPSVVVTAPPPSTGLTPVSRPPSVRPSTRPTVRVHVGSSPPTTSAVPSEYQPESL